MAIVLVAVAANTPHELFLNNDGSTIISAPDGTGAQMVRIVNSKDSNEINGAIQSTAKSIPGSGLPSPIWWTIFNILRFVPAMLDLRGGITKIIQRSYPLVWPILSLISCNVTINEWDCWHTHHHQQPQHSTFSRLTGLDFHIQSSPLCSSLLCYHIRFLHPLFLRHLTHINHHFSSPSVRTPWRFSWTTTPS